MKNSIKYILQRLLGFHSYLYLFARFKIKTLRFDKKEEGFFTFLEQVKTGGILLDIGANIGVMSYHMAKAFPGSTVYAFEPIPDNVQVIRRVAINYELRNVEVCETAVGEKDGVLEMVMPEEGKVRMQGLSHVKHTSIQQPAQGTSYKTTVVRLDDLAELKGDHEQITGIKIDIENFEHFALIGMQELLARSMPPIYIELWENENRRRCFELLHGLGYVAYISSGGKLVPYEEGSIDTQYFIFVRTV